MVTAVCPSSQVVFCPIVDAVTQTDNDAYCFVNFTDARNESLVSIESVNQLLSSGIASMEQMKQTSSVGRDLNYDLIFSTG